MFAFGRDSSCIPVPVLSYSILWVGCQSDWMAIFAPFKNALVNRCLYIIMVRHLTEINLHFT